MQIKRKHLIIFWKTKTSYNSSLRILRKIRVLLYTKC